MFSVLRVGRSTEEIEELKFPGRQIAGISIKGGQTLVTYKSGDVWADGKAYYDKLENRLEKPTKIPLQMKIKFAAASDFSCIYLTKTGNMIFSKIEKQNPITLGKGLKRINDIGAVASDGSFYLFYKDFFGFEPKEFVIPKPAADVARSFKHYHVLTQDGEIFTSDTLDINSCTFALNKSLEGVNITKISSFSRHCIALSANGEVYACGWNKFGQLGDGTKEDRTTGFVKVKGLEDHKILDIAAGGSFSLFLDEEGWIYSCGDNKYGQLIQSTKGEVLTPTKCQIRDRATMIAAGGNDTVIVTKPTPKGSLARIELSLLEALKNSDNNKQNQEVDYEMIALDESNYEIIKKLGKGRFGQTYLVRDRTTKNVLVMKTLKNKNNFVQENKLRFEVRNQCLLSYIGFNRKANALYSEKAEHGNLQSVLKSNSADWDSTTKSLCILDIVCAMKHLHQFEIVHRNLKPSNILCTNDMNFKVCDFRECNTKDLVEVLFDDLESVKFVAPEVMQFKPFTKSSDVYSFAMIFYLIINGSLPNMKLSDLIKGKRPRLPNNLPNFVKEMIERCWAVDPLSRPSFSEIWSVLSSHDFMIFDDVDSSRVCERHEQISSE